MSIVRILSETQAFIEEATAKELLVVDQALSFDVPGAQFSTLFKNGIWDGKKHLFSVLKRTLPTGLVSRALSVLPKKRTTVIDERKLSKVRFNVEEVGPNMLHGVDLRDYQIEAVRRALLARRGILKLATGAGKTAVAAALIKNFLANNEDVEILYVVHTRVLMEQARKDLSRYLGIPHGDIGLAGNGAFFPRQITVGIVNSLFRKRLKNPFKSWLPKRDVLILDELHHQRAATHFPVSQACSSASFRFGLSATPWANEGDRMMVEAATGPVLLEVKSDELIKAGYLAKPTVEILRYDTPSLDGEWKWSAIYKTGIVENPDRNATIVRKATSLVNDGKQVLILVAQVWHGEILSSLFEVQKIRHKFVHARVPVSVIEGVKEEFAERIFPVLIASPVFGEGVDIPIIEALIIADGGKSFRGTLQKVGRGLRKKKEGENVVLVVDLADTAHPLLAKHSRERISTYQREFFKVVVS